MFFRSKSDKPAAEKPPVNKSADIAQSITQAAVLAPTAPAQPFTMPTMSPPQSAAVATVPSTVTATQPEVADPAQASAKKDPAVAFSQAVGIFMRAPQTRDLKIADIEWLLIPALKYQQIAIAEAKLKNGSGNVPIAVLLWADVSAEVERRLIADKSAISRIEPADWKSGNIPWIIAALGPADVLKNMVTQLVAGPLGGRRVRGRVVGANGTVSVQEFG